MNFLKVEVTEQLSTSIIAHYCIKPKCKKSPKIETKAM